MNHFIIEMIKSIRKHCLRIESNELKTNHRFLVIFKIAMFVHQMETCRKVGDGSERKMHIWD